MHRASLAPVRRGLWLDQHNPMVSWTEGQSTRWSPNCQEQCFQGAIISLATTTSESPDQPTTVHIPSEYQDLQDVFIMERASRLPSHHSYYCAITLLPGTSPLWGRVYLLSLDEQRAMEEYIQEALQQGCIRHFTNPVSAGCLLHGEKGGWMHRLARSQLGFS